MVFFDLFQQLRRAVDVGFCNDAQSQLRQRVVFGKAHRIVHCRICCFNRAFNTVLIVLCARHTAVDILLIVYFYFSADCTQLFVFAFADVGKIFVGVKLFAVTDYIPVVACKNAVLKAARQIFRVSRIAVT